LPTPSGRIEICSERIAGFGYADCPGHPVWLEPREWLGGPLARRFPFHLVSNQPWTKLHSQYDHAALSRGAKIRGREPLTMHPDDAAERGLVAGDVLRVFNDRGACLAGLRVDAGIRRGVVEMATGAWYDPVEPGAPGTLDKHGNPNVLCPDFGASQLSQGCAAHTCLVEVERFDGPLPPLTAFDPPAFVAPTHPRLREIAMSIRADRERAVHAAIAQVKRIHADGALDRRALGRFLDVLKALAARPELWSDSDFPAPEDGVRQARYLIREDPDRTFALYLNVMRRGNRTPVHNHTTWACIAAVDGAESNHQYRRCDDGTRPGYADVIPTGKVDVRPGGGIALMPDDIHAVEIEDDEVIRHLHLYGRALETLTDRLAFDLANKTCGPMNIGVQTRRT
jgi:predicted metal-dependent enzyme (double-stranded beta helix superfamily)